MVGRTAELRVLTERIERRGVQRLALVGGGGSGKSLLACALGHRLRSHFGGGVHWLRVGSWDASTLVEMLSRRLGVSRAGGQEDPFRDSGRRVDRVREAFRRRGRSLVVLDNHENDRSMARFLEALRDCPVTWVVTARRCLLSGVEIFPVVPPMVTEGRSAFARVASLTALLRWNPLALDIADGLLASRAVGLTALRRWLVEGGVERIAPMDNEDDVAEVRLLVEWAWGRLPAAARRMLAVLAHSEGDDVDGSSLAQMARVTGGGASALATLRRFRLVQEPLAGRFALHAVVRQAVARRTRIPADRFFRHYVRLLERHPERVDLEQTHLYAAMDRAHTTSDLPARLRLDRLLARLESGVEPEGARGGGSGSS
jgi:NB-ARC domain